MRTGASFTAVMLAVFALTAAFLATTAADVTIQGGVQYFDRVANKYKAARNVLVEVEGDWWDADPRVYTNDLGLFQATQRDPWSGTFDISIDAYASTPGYVEVYEDWFEASWDAYPYHATSKTVTDVDEGETVTIGLKIGGPQNDAVDVWTRTFEETANAFVVHQEMMDHYGDLRLKGAIPDGMREIEVIVPAAGVTAYYNHFTAYINLVVDAAGGTGLDNWTNIPTGPDYFVPDYPDFPMMVRHEFSHAIHAHMLEFVEPMGLNMPASHHPEMESNRWLAYTEGWAEFLPLTTLNMGGKFEAAPRTPPIGADIGIPTPDPPGGHYAWEGEVASLLWDLYDPVGDERMRHPARKATTGENVHLLIVREQRFRDGIADPSLNRIARVASEYSVAVVDPVDTIAEFLSVYEGLYIADSHALKAIAFNRDIVESMPMERPAYILGAPSIRRELQDVIFDFIVTELDPEDRPYVRAEVWHAPGTHPPKQLANETLQTGWNGSTRPTSLRVAVPQPVGDSDTLWLIVNDDMLPTAYRVPNVSDWTGLVTQLLRKWLGINMGDARLRNLEFDGEIIKAKPPEDATTVAPRLVRAPPALVRLPTKDEQTAGRDLGAAIANAGEELANYASRIELSRDMDRGALRFARVAGGLSEPGNLRALQLRKQPKEARRDALLRVTDLSSLPNLEQWTDQVASGKLDGVTVPAQAREALRARGAVLTEKLQEQQDAVGGANRLIRDLRQARDAAPFDRADPQIQEQTQQVVRALAQGLRTMQADDELAPRLEKHVSVLRGLEGAGKPKLRLPARVPGRIRLRPAD